jgi:hypothetical protein
VFQDENGLGRPTVLLTRPTGVWPLGHSGRPQSKNRPRGLVPVDPSGNTGRPACLRLSVRSPREGGAGDSLGFGATRGGASGAYLDRRCPGPPPDAAALPTVSPQILPVLRSPRPVNLIECLGCFFANGAPRSMIPHAVWCALPSPAGQVSCELLLCECLRWSSED